MPVLSLKKFKPMTTAEIYKKLEPIIAVYLPEDVPFESISPESNLTSELNINSAHLVDIVLDIEDAFDIEFENEVFENLQSVQDVVSFIRDKVT